MAVSLSTYISRIFTYILDECTDEDAKAELLVHLAEVLPDYRSIIIPILEFYEKNGSFLSLKAAIDELGLPITPTPSGISTPEDCYFLIKRAYNLQRERIISDKLLSIIQKRQRCEHCDECKGSSCPNYVEDIVTEIQNLLSLKSLELNEDEFTASMLLNQYFSRDVKRGGAVTNIKQFDDVIGEISPGTLFTFAGYVGSYKTTFAVNYMYHNLVNRGLNVVYLTGEMGKEILSTYLISRHTLHPKFDPSYCPIDKSLIRFRRLTKEQEQYLLNEVVTDLDTNEQYGKYLIMDFADIGDMQVSSIRKLLLSVPFEVDIFIVDYIQLTKFRLEEHKYTDPINVFIRTVNDFALSLYKDHRFSVLLLSQINREGYKKAILHEGAYDLSALAEANELERSSTYVITSFVDQELKDAKEAKMQLLKHRFGDTIADPIIVPVRPEYCLVGDSYAADDNIDDFDLADLCSDSPDLMIWE